MLATSSHKLQRQAMRAGRRVGGTGAGGRNATGRVRALRRTRSAQVNVQVLNKSNCVDHATYVCISCIDTQCIHVHVHVHVHVHGGKVMLAIVFVMQRAHFILASKSISLVQSPATISCVSPPTNAPTAAPYRSPMLR